MQTLKEKWDEFMGRVCGTCGQTYLKHYHLDCPDENGKKNKVGNKFIESVSVPHETSKPNDKE